MNYSIKPSPEVSRADSLRKVTAIHDGKQFQIDPTPWGTAFYHTTFTPPGLPFAVNAYIERSGSNEAQLVPSNVCMILVKPSRWVPHGAKLIRMSGSNSLWMLYFPPKPMTATATGRKEDKAAVEKKAQPSEKGGGGVNKAVSGKKEATAEAGGEKKGKAGDEVKAPADNKAKTLEQSSNVKADNNGKYEVKQVEKSSSEDKEGKIDHEAKWRLPGKFAPEFVAFLNLAKECSGFDEAFFDAYAAEVGPDVTGDDVRVDFCNELADPSLRHLHPDEGDDFWEELWQLGTRDGTLHGPNARHWSVNVTTPPPKPSKVDEARARRVKTVSLQNDYKAAIGQAIGETSEDKDLVATAELFLKPENCAICSSMDDAQWDTLWSVITRKETLKGVPKDWRDGVAGQAQAQAGGRVLPDDKLRRAAP